MLIRRFLSVRRGYHFIPKHIIGMPSDVFASQGPSLPHWLEVRVFGVMLRMISTVILRRFGLPKPDHRIFESHPLMNTQILHYLGHGDCIAKPDVERFDGDHVVFVDGTREQIDLVITATGYQHAIPFLNPGALSVKGGRPDLYLGIFSRSHPESCRFGVSSSLLRLPMTTSTRWPNSSSPTPLLPAGSPHRWRHSGT